MSLAERNKKLQEVFKVSSADLSLNKQGIVSESQSATLQTYRRGRMTSLISFGVMFVILCLVCVGVGISLLVNPEKSGNIIRPAIVFASGVAMFLYVLSALNFFLRSGDILTGKISQKEGVATLYTRQYRDEYRYMGMGWFVKIDKKEFRLSTATHYAALEEGTAYRIYYVKGYPLDLLLAVEAI